MANRTTVKNNIQVLNVPTVSNADMNTMLQTNICDNVRFKEDVAVDQTSTVTAITCDFTGKDRINLTRTGGPLAISVSGISDGDCVYIFITKTAGQSVAWTGVTDITPVKANANALTTVVYEVIRKGSSYFARALVETVIAATDAETVTGTLTTRFTTPANIQAKAASSAETITGTLTTKFVTPAGLNSKRASTTAMGIVRKGAESDIFAANDAYMGAEPYYVPPSAITNIIGGLKTKVIEIGDWNMDANSSVNVAHGLTFSKIRGVESVSILRDSASYLYDLASYGGKFAVVGSNVYIERDASGFFDNPNFITTPFNRGFITIKYIP